jgi:predicted Zn finger-like uncharacterized protein
MALATTCPRCQTGFRVVPDQLKIRRGLVRCGHCRHVFSGLDSLRYVGDASGAPPPGIGPAAAAVARPVAPPVERQARTRPPEQRRAGPGFDDPATLLLPDSVDDLTDAPARPASIREDFVLEGLDELDDLGALANPSPDGDASAPPPPVRAPEASGERQDPSDRSEVSPSAAEPGTSRLPDAPDAASTVEDPSAAWSAAVLAPEPDEQPSVAGTTRAEAVDFFASPSRAGGFTSRGNAIAALACGVLGLTLALQLAIVGRDWVAARLPAAEAGLGSIAGALGLVLEPPRQLTALTLESFDVHAGTSAQALMLNALLRNQATHRVRWPSMELTLTDAAGGVIVRKVLSPGEYLPAAQVSAGAPPERELPLQVALETVGIQPAGYNVKLFYP